jgi:Flp pilus assembly pilin Flp
MQHESVCGLEPERFEGDRGSNLVEYAMLVALIVVVCLGALTFFGQSATGKMSCVSSAIAGQVSNIRC